MTGRASSLSSAHSLLPPQIGSLYGLGLFVASPKCSISLETVAVFSRTVHSVEVQRAGLSMAAECGSSFRRLMKLYAADRALVWRQVGWASYSMLNWQRVY